MVTFAPGKFHRKVTHVMYNLLLNGPIKKLIKCHTYETDSDVITCSTSAFWNTIYGPRAVIYDESSSKLVFLDWLRRRPDVALHVDDCIIAIKEVPTGDPKRFRLGCLGIAAVHFFDVEC
ncbi:unnamed protein product [Gongylonema pulchrum]|uniref:FBA_2 domain-containing protein n=1 Tax=Gongylonema pulchrum TaxID=637853 RepID=A0A183EMV1_9BILA|nr:unnamed protein product [Gongylonema pulchrum]